MNKLKDNLKKCLDRRNSATKSGVAYSKLPKCKYFEQLLFLCDKSSNKPTESNVAVICNRKNPTQSHVTIDLETTPSKPTTSKSYVEEPCELDSGICKTKLYGDKSKGKSRA